MMEDKLDDLLDEIDEMLEYTETREERAILLSAKAKTLIALQKYEN